MEKTIATTSNKKTSSQPFFQPLAKTGPRIQLQGNSTQPRFNPLDPNVMREAARRAVEQREAPVRQWLESNLRSYRLMDGNDIIRILRREVPVARQFAIVELQSLIRYVSNLQGYSPPLMGSVNAWQSSIPDLSKFTQFNFQWGPTHWNIKIPSSLRINLPVALSSSNTIQFSLSATTSGTFNFFIELDAFEHMKISSTSSVDIAGNAVRTGLRIESRRTVCRAQDPQIARENILRKGRGLTRAINELQSPTAPEPGEEAASQFDRMKDVVSAIADMYSAVNTATSACRQVPGIAVDIGAQSPLNNERAREERQGSQVGITLTIPF